MNDASLNEFIQKLKSYIEEKIVFHEEELEKAGKADNPYGAAIHSAKIDTLKDVQHSMNPYVRTNC